MIIDKRQEQGIRFNDSMHNVGLDFSEKPAKTPVAEKPVNEKPLKKAAAEKSAPKTASRKKTPAKKKKS